MTLYLVKHGSNDYRLQDADGTEIDTWSSDPRESSEGVIPTLVDGIANSAYPADDLLGDPTVRKRHAMVVAGQWHYRDLTIPDETVPWK
jgi:hypothetical protein